MVVWVSEVSSRINDLATVRREYASEERFLARRLANQATLRGPIVEDEAIRAVAEGAPHRVLDIGCGTGDFSERLQRETGAEVVGLDLSPRMAELTQARGLGAIVASIEALPIPSGTFECVLANRVLYHVPDLDAGIAEIARVLAPGGRLVAVTYGSRHLQELWDALGEPNPSSTSTFSSDSGGAALRNHFAGVKQRDYAGEAVFADRAAIEGLLSGFAELSTADLAAKADNVETPFTSTYRHTVFVARRGTTSA